MIRERAIAVAALAFVFGCSAQVSVEKEPPVLPPEAAPDVADCAPPLLVPEGRAWLGSMRWRGGKLVTVGCDAPNATVTLRLVVPDFFLDQDEVTNACYRLCVDAGACASPLVVPRTGDVEPWPHWEEASMRQVPAQRLDGAMAEAFCAWRGGRLPSLAELIRAEHGQAVAVVNSALTELWLVCAQEPEPQECGEIWDRVYSWPSPVRSWNLDQGPFGHFDLAGSVVELTRTGLPATVEEQEALCTIPLDATDPGSFGSGERVGFATAGHLLTSPIEGDTVAPLVQGSVDGTGVKGGVRCAYDPL
jgi:formylglycine-generating enzyme required for sulfatase activity